MKTKSRPRLAIFASGSGTNAEAIMAYFQHLDSADVVLLLSNNLKAGALARAEKFAVPTKVFTKQQFNESDEVLRWLRDASVTHIVLAGFMWLVPSSLIKEFPGRIINIHPSLLPLFSGKGMYGMKVHEAVKMSGQLKTGITIHVVNEHYDEGEILFQEYCLILPEETALHIAEKIHRLEHRHYPEVIERWIS